MPCAPQARPGPAPSSRVHARRARAGRDEARRPPRCGARTPRRSVEPRERANDRDQVPRTLALMSLCRTRDRQARAVRTAVTTARRGREVRAAFVPVRRAELAHQQRQLDRCAHCDDALADQAFEQVRGREPVEHQRASGPRLPCEREDPLDVLGQQRANLHHDRVRGVLGDGRPQRAPIAHAARA